ncbi:putative mobile element protein [Streptomyces sp. Tu6071]|nr:putative mobile element protein [Streptomyces sp. Tu6071]
MSYGTGTGEVSWRKCAVELVDGAWPGARLTKNVAKTLMVATIPLLRTPPPVCFDPVRVRTAFREWVLRALDIAT